MDETPRGYHYHMTVQKDGAAVLPASLLQRIGAAPGDRITLVLSGAGPRCLLLTTREGKPFPWERSY